jgi:large subunit ribosomal protein L21
MRLINENVEREAEGADIQKWKNRGYAELETEEIPSDSAEDNSETEDSSSKEDKQNLEALTIQELKELAKSKGLEGTSSLNKQQLIDVLKEE